MYSAAPHATNQPRPSHTALPNGALDILTIQRRERRILAMPRRPTIPEASHRVAHVRARLHRVAFCSRRWTSYAVVARGPTRANVAYRRTFPPVVGTTENRVGVLVSGNSHPIKDSLFSRSDQKSQPIQKGLAMSDFTHLNSSPTRDQHHFWRSIVVPTAAGIERFIWRVTWFSLFVWVLLQNHA